eukprot:4006065-Pleurochrysis_carterae.AAC.3
MALIPGNTLLTTGTVPYMWPFEMTCCCSTCYLHCLSNCHAAQMKGSTTTSIPAYGQFARLVASIAKDDREEALLEAARTASRPLSSTQI